MTPRFLLDTNIYDKDPAGLIYTFRVSDGPRIASWNGTDTTMPEALAPLIDRLSELAVEAAKQRG